MKSVYCFFLCVFLLGCNERSNDKILHEVEGNIETNLEYAQSLLDGIDNPLYLSDKNYAKYIFLSCKIADCTNSSFPLSSDLRKATNWYKKKGKKSDLAQIYMYLGRSYVETEEYQKAILEYLKSFEISVDNNFLEQAGYASSYMGDLYTDINDLFAAAEKYEEASHFFKQTNNQRSYAFALRDLGRTWALVDSLDKALECFLLAESVANILKENHIRSNILNGIGNVYRLKKEYDKAEKILIASLELDTLERTPSLNALADVYINQNNFSKARRLLDSIASLNLHSENQYFLNYKYYQLNKKENNTHEALTYLEDVFYLIQSNTIIDSEQAFQKLEKKYAKSKFLIDLQKVQLSRQLYLFISVSLLALVFLLIIFYQKRKIVFSDKISKQDREINDLVLKYHSVTKLFNKDISILQAKKKEEVDRLSKKLKQSRHARLFMSDIGKKLTFISKKMSPSSGKTNVTSRMWNAISKEVKLVYPDFEQIVYELCPNLTDSEWLYCCFLLFNFDNNEEAILLNISPNTARQKKTRMKKRLGLSLDNTNIYDHLVQML